MEQTNNELVRCPNYCNDGQIKILDYDGALFAVINCPYCNGKGKVTKNKALEIDKLL